MACTAASHEQVDFSSVNRSWHSARLPNANAKRVVKKLDGNEWTLDGLPVLVPNAWNKIDGANGISEGNSRFAPSIESDWYARRRGVYSRSLPNARKGRRYFIRCEGASQTAVVRVNGTKIGTHKGAFTAFCFEATAAMMPTGNQLEIEVSNEFDPAIPPLSGDFTLCGGLYRSVWLIETDPVCIDPTIAGGSGVRVFPEMNGTVRVEVDISGADDAVVDWTPKKIANPKLWSPEEPNMYEVAVTVRKGLWSDTVCQSFGFRTAEIRKDGFYLNGVKRKVRGVNRHQDLEGMGWEQSSAQEERDIRLVKAMGADGIRLAHYPQSGNVFDLCDRYGLMVWSETPLVGICGDGDFRVNAETVMREMVAQHRNHPSVCWWGVWNELGVSGVKTARDVAVATRLAELCRSLDTSRPIVAATCMPKLKELNKTVPHIAYNIYPGWYTKMTMKEHVDELLALNEIKVAALSEYGAGASVFQHENPVTTVDGTSHAKFHPEEYQTLVHMADYREIVSDDRLWGSFVWAMFDFASDARREGDRDGVNDKGLVTRDRVTPKDAYFMYKANWNPEPMLHLCGKRLRKIEHGKQKVDIVAFSNAGAVTLTVNGKTIGTKTPDEIKAVTFASVPLSIGANNIAVEAGNLRDEYSCKVMDM